MLDHLLLKLVVLRSCSVIECACMLNSFYLEVMHFSFDYGWAEYTMQLCCIQHEKCIMIDRVAHTKTLFHATFWSCIQLSFGQSMSFSIQLDWYNFSQISMTYWHVANENTGHGTCVYVCKQFCERSMADTTAKLDNSFRSVWYAPKVGWLVVLRLNVPVNNFSVMSGRSHRFLGN